MTLQRTKEVLAKEKLEDTDLVYLLGLDTPEDTSLLQEAAFETTTRHCGNRVYYRGLIEASNICTAGCRYCGIRRQNREIVRYTMSSDEIVGCAVAAARMGYGSVCIQAGERRDPKWTDFIESVLREIHGRTLSEKLPEGLGITLSLGEQTHETYLRWAAAAGCPGSLRYLARFETSNPKLFRTLHGERGNHEKILAHRFSILESLRRAGYQTGTGVMIGIPGQTLKDLARDIRTFETLDIDMIGMGPYLLSRGGVLGRLGQLPEDKLLRLSLNMIAATRLLLKDINIASATALQAIRPNGRELGILHGANVMMPNITPLKYREGYQLYLNKPGLRDTPESVAKAFEKSILRAGRKVGWDTYGSSERWKRRQIDYKKTTVS